MRRTVLTIGAYTFATLLSIAILQSTDWQRKPWHAYMWGHTFHVIAGVAIPILLFALVTAATIFRRQLSERLHRLRGQCPHCAYDLRAHDAGAPCPECGQSRGASA